MGFKDSACSTRPSAGALLDEHSTAMKSSLQRRITRCVELLQRRILQLSFVQTPWGCKLAQVAESKSPMSFMEECGRTSQD